MTTKEKIAVMQAYVDGNKIQISEHGAEKWVDCLVDPSYDWVHCDYRVKPEEKYRPYKDYHEMVEDFCERFGVNCPKYAMPLIWIKNKESDYVYMINAFQGYNSKDAMENYFKNYTYLDGSSVGKKVEE